MTYTDLITDALRRVGIISETETPSAEQGQAALRVMNEMGAYWNANGIVLGYVPVTDPTDTLTLHPAYLEPIKNNLAVRLAADYRIPPAADIGMWAKEGLDFLRRESMVAQIKSVNLYHLPFARRPPAAGWLFLSGTTIAP